MRHVGGQRRSALLAVAALVLVGCSDARSSDPDDPDDPTKQVSVSEDSTDVSPVEEALGLLPPDVGLVDFSSDRHSAERLGLIDDDAATLTDLGTSYADRVDAVDQSDLAAIGALADAVEEMTEGGATFSQVDVRWTMLATTDHDPLDDDARSVQAFRLVDGIDMTDVVADLEDAGFERTTDDGWEKFHLDGQLSEEVDVLDGNTIDGRFPELFFPDVAVHPDAHLVALGDTEVLVPDGSSRETVEALRTLLPTAPEEVERFALTPYSYMRCYEPVSVTTDNRATPRAIAAWSRQFGIEELGVPGATMLTWVPGEEVVHRSLFADEAAAQRALEGRKRLYGGAAVESEEPLGVLMPADGNESPYEAGWQMSREGRIVTVLHNATNPDDAIYTYSRHGLGFDTCGAPGMFS